MWKLPLLCRCPNFSAEQESEHNVHLHEHRRSWPAPLLPRGSWWRIQIGHAQSLAHHILDVWPAHGENALVPASVGSIQHFGLFEWHFLQAVLFQCYSTVEKSWWTMINQTRIMAILNSGIGTPRKCSGHHIMLHTGECACPEKCCQQTPIWKAVCLLNSNKTSNKTGTCIKEIGQASDAIGGNP